MKRPLAAVAAALLAGVFAEATERKKPKPLPSFTVVATDGRSVQSAALSEERQWLLIYLTPASPRCDRLLKALAEWRSPQLDARTIVIVHGTPGEARTCLETVGGSGEGPAVFADPPRRAHSALRLAAESALVAVKDGRVAWTIEGVLNDPEAVEPVIKSWLLGP
jgi:hypothetical protein